MNIALISYQYPPGVGQSGVANYTRRLAHGLSRLGHSVHIVAHTDPEDGAQQDIGDGDVLVHRIREPKWIQNIPGIKVIAYRLVIYQALMRLHKEYRFDIVECPNSAFQGLLLVLLSKPFPLVMRVHTPMFESWGLVFEKLPLKFRLICLLEKFVVMRADALVTSTAFYAKKIGSAYNFPESRFAVVPLGIPLPDKEKLNETPNNPHVRILFVGRLIGRKGIRYLLEAVPVVLKDHLDAQFVFVGKDVGGFRKSFEEQYDCFGGRVKFLDAVSDEALEQHYRDCDIFVAPSLSESFGLIFAEAMSWGKPVVACDVCAVGEVVSHNESGILVEPRNAIQISGALGRLISDIKLRQRMGRHGREICEEKFSAETMAKNTEKFYLDAIAARRK